VVYTGFIASFASFKNRLESSCWAETRHKRGPHAFYINRKSVVNITARRHAGRWGECDGHLKPDGFLRDANKQNGILLIEKERNTVLPTC